MRHRTHTVRRRMPRRLLLLPCALVALVFALWAALPVGSGAISNQERLSELQNKIEATQGKIGRKKGTERVLTQDISRWTAKIRRLEGRIGSLQARQSAIQADLDGAQGKLDRTRADLRFERARQVRLKARLAEGRRILATRLVERYQEDTPDLVTVVLSSKGFAELLERGEFLQRINEQDQRIIRLVGSARLDAKENAARLGTLAERQAALAARIASRRNEVASVKQELIDTRVGFDRTRRGKANALRSVRDDRHELEGSLSAMKKTQAKIQGVLSTPGGTALPVQPIKGGGRMIWPIQGTLTSPFCEARSWESCHPGIDIAAPTGTPIRAALGGQVRIAGPTGGYGNYTCIQHTASLSSCYGHQSSIGVSVGQNVTQGQVIGAVGSTGFSTGPHLHFEVRINGAVTSPMNYL
jgi:murein DD-endopeptidase MepM/ murein hydrolase activator NlpD